jgi:hypothetical protein
VQFNHAPRSRRFVPGYDCDVKFNVYGRFVIDVVREKDRWAMFEVVPGKRLRITDFAIPPSLDESQLPQYLDDIYHEMGQPGDKIVPIE